MGFMKSTVKENEFSSSFITIYFPLDNAVVTADFMLAST